VGILAAEEMPALRIEEYDALLFLQSRSRVLPLPAGFHQLNENL
jgi:hypothetical protein